MTDPTDPLHYGCSVCSAKPGQPCRDKTKGWVDCEPCIDRVMLAQGNTRT